MMRSEKAVEEDDGPEEVHASSDEVQRLRELHEKTLETTARKKRRRRRAEVEDDDEELPAEAVVGLDPQESRETIETSAPSTTVAAPSQLEMAPVARKM